jgi:hypothetical protein
VGPCRDLLLQKTLQIEKSSGFRSAEYDDQSAGVQNSAVFSLKNSWVVLEVFVGAKSCWKIKLRTWIHPQDPGDHMLLQEVWINVDFDSLADTNENYQTLLEVMPSPP